MNDHFINGCISVRHRTKLLVYPCDLKVKRRIQVVPPDSPHPHTHPLHHTPLKRGAKRGKIVAYSPSAARRFRHLLRNTTVRFRAHLVLTYGASWPSDGHVLKRHLRALVQVLRRRKCKGVWKLEFQKRGAPHFHILLDKPVSHAVVRQAWRRILGASDGGTWYGRTRCSFYLAKQSPTPPPPTLRNVGRFYGTFNLPKVEPCYVFEGSAQEIAPIVRVARKYQQSRKPRSRRRHYDRGRNSYTLYGGARALLNLGSRTGHGQTGDRAIPVRKEILQ